MQNFESNISVQPDGTLRVTEKIKVRNEEGGEIQRGIYRYFPNPNFEVIAVKRDGDKTTYRVEASGDRKRIEIWKEDVYLDPGTYTYTIKYRTDSQIATSGNQDELYWNVTGQDWVFPLEKVEARVNLPEELPAERVSLNAFTGKEGETGQSYQANLEGKSAVFTTTRTLSPSEGMSVVVQFPSGYVESATQESDSFRVFWVLLLLAVWVLLLLSIVRFLLCGNHARQRAYWWRQRWQWGDWQRRYWWRRCWRRWRWRWIVARKTAISILSRPQSCSAPLPFPQVTPCVIFTLNSVRCCVRFFH
ncbi:MAG: hypothetical protein BRC53_00405 [Cyanobacteria bacterium SW_6_48_11]|nr:MAG: hypothetical protein BRC53_00405 [Cyanobacteria bacterium SW_6_48_11]